MKRFLKQWLITEGKFLLCIYGPVITTLIFGVLKVIYYPDSGMLSVGIFYLCALTFFVYKFR
ncbi:hypothetical protein SAMN06273570_4854 [Candidatus Pantoea floridensis]|uniref:Uncharacterized protein n=1 Tax=Candidatus Pantoea floridensis TaxID=1938870 RepID=A0A286DQ37_9GAMM|nr:hypothetical protein BX596_4042 [Enterobacteriaceae bacterium JKS000233]SOD60812.1 hypothetical protein SAMN06273570_4854 [Pantoea floridensis]